jgi:hypothetical protein
MMFASAFYLYLGPRKSDEFGFHDDGAPSAFGTFPYTIYILILLGFVGEFDPDNFYEVAVRVLLVFFILVVMIVFLNVLIVNRCPIATTSLWRMPRASSCAAGSELITETALIRVASCRPGACRRLIIVTISASLSAAPPALSTRLVDDNPNCLKNTTKSLLDDRELPTSISWEVELSHTRLVLGYIEGLFQSPHQMGGRICNVSVKMII